MAYEIYVREFPSKSMAPTITISPLGRCTLNRSAAEMLNKEAVENALLLWDKAARKFAIRPITKKDDRSFNIRYSKKDKTITGAAFSGVMFLRHIGYDFTNTSTYPIKRDAEAGIYEVELPEERFGTHEQQQQLIAVQGGKKHGKGA